MRSGHPQTFSSSAIYSASRCGTLRPLLRQAGKGSATILWLRGTLRRRCVRHYMAENSKRKWIILILAAVLVVVVVAVLALREPAPVVQLVSVTREDLTSTITSNGKV